MSATGSRIEKVNVLLVDDKPANLVTLGAILTGLDLDLICVHSGEQALEVLETRDVAVVLLDVRMPGLSGLDTARILRSSDRVKHTPIIFLTATADDQAEALAAYELGAVDYLLKPLVPAVVRAKVSTLVDLFQAKERSRREADQLRLLVQGTTEYAIFMLKPDGTIATWNAGAARLKGYAADEAIGKHFSTFYPQEALDRGWPAHELKVAAADGRFEDEGWRVRKDGSQFWANVVITALRDDKGSLEGFSKVTRNLTDRRQREEDLERRVAERTAELSAAYEALRKKEAELTDFIENATVGLHWVGPDGTILWANKCELDLLGYTREEYIGRNIADFHADKGVITDILCRLTNNEKLEGHEARLKCKDGSIRHVLISSNVYRENGEFRHTRCFTRDVTERVRAKGRQRFLADQASATQELTDPDAITAATARVLGEHLGADRCAYAEMEPDEDHMLITGDHCRGVPSIVGRYTLSDFGAEVVHLHKKNLPYVVRDAENDPRVTPADRAAYRQTSIRAVVSVPLFKAGRFVAGMAVHQTSPREWTADEIEIVQLAAARCWESIERARTARSLKESEERFRLLADGIPNLAWMATGDGHVFWYNSRWYEYTGATPEEMEGWGWQRVMDPAALPAVLERWKQSITTGDPFDMVFPIRAADGMFRPFLTRVLAQRDAGGAIVRWFGTNTDISEQKAAEAALRERDRQKDEFMAMLAHELRNPLAPIKNALHILQLKKDESTVEKVRQMVGRQVGQLSHLVDDLLEAARVTTKKIELRKELLDLARLARVAANDAAAAFEAASVTLAVEAPETPVWVSGDWTRLTQVVGNLLGNAAKFTPAGGRVTVSIGGEGDSATLSVRDTGDGIAPELLGQLFTPFIQGEQGLARSKGGLGLGLSLVKGIVELHGGTVAAESAGLGTGSTFTVRLARADEPLAVSGDRDQPQKQVGQQLRVLIVEDNIDSAESLREVLQLGGCDVSLAHTGPDGVALAKRLRPKLVICDIGLPGYSGFEVARRIRAESNGSTVLVALTGYGRDEDREEAKAAGFNLHFTKPVDFRQLEQVLSGVR